jgi:hypothetical protein
MVLANDIESIKTEFQENLLNEPKNFKAWISEAKNKYDSDILKKVLMATPLDIKTLIRKFPDDHYTSYQELNQFLNYKEFQKTLLANDRKSLFEALLSEYFSMLSEDRPNFQTWIRNTAALYGLDMLRLVADADKTKQQQHENAQYLTDLLRHEDERALIVKRLENESISRIAGKTKTLFALPPTMTTIDDIEFKFYGPQGRNSSNAPLGNPYGWTIVPAGKKHIYSSQGWKIHISAQLEKAVDIAKEVIPILLEEAVFFKVARSHFSYKELFADAQGGKFITIYSENDDQAKRIAKRLDEVLSNKFSKDDFYPIRYDAKLGESGGIYTRFGSYKSNHVEVNGQQILDDRTKYKPDQLTNHPFGDLLKEPK